MATTHLFVELLVIGLGSLLCIVLLGAALFDYDPLTIEAMPPLASLVPLLAFAYLLGIITDRLADWTFARWDDRLQDAVFRGRKDAYREGRRTMALYGRQLWDHLEYVRSRLRICRGWVLNCAGLLICFDLFLWKGRHAPELSGLQVVSINLTLLAMLALCVVCWRSLNVNEYRKIERQSGWLAEPHGSKGDKNVFS